MAPLDPAWKGKYAWSVSSDRLWQTCKRAFYYRYVALWQPSTDSAVKNKLYLMKGLTPLATLQGRVVHDAIESLIQQHRLGRPLKAAPAQELYSETINRYTETAADVIAEAYNGLTVEGAYFDVVRRSGKRDIANFVNILWQHLVDQEYLMHERFESFTLDAIKVNVKVDYVTRSPNGKLVVTDWKTGEDHHPEEANLQLVVYGLWAAAKYGVSTDDVMLELAYLSSGKSYPAGLDVESVTAAREAVMAGASDILASDRLEDFPTNPEPNRCIACPFARVCPDGTQILEDYFSAVVRESITKLSRQGAIT